MANRARPHEPLQCPDDDQADQRDQLEAQEIAGEAMREKPVRRGAPIGDVVRDQRDRHDAEHRPLGRNLDADRHERLHDAQSGPRHAEKSRRLTTQAVGCQGGSGLAVQVQTEGVAKAEVRTCRPGGELNPPRARHAIDGQQQNRERVIQSEQSPRG